jgi:hypothetical protein
MIKKVILYIAVILSTVNSFCQPDQKIKYQSILKRASKYDNTFKPEIPSFFYQNSNSPELVSLRKRFNLDSIAGFGNEVSRLLNLLHWVHNTVRHDGQNESGINEINALSIITTSKSKHIGVSCGELATTLNDCYLAMGWDARKVYCFPKDSLNIDHDSHVINIVYLSSKKKWIWVDPTNDAYVMDEQGDLLSIQEVRERLILNKPLIVNPDANWNHASSMTKDYYLDFYMTKNLYEFYCPLKSEYNYETSGKNKQIIYIILLPLDSQTNQPFKTEKYYPDTGTTKLRYYIYNANLFWQLPEN